MPFPAKDLLRQHYRTDPRTVPRGQGRETRLSGKWLLVCDGFRPYLSKASRCDHSKESCQPGFSTSGSVRVCALFEPSEMLLGAIWH